MTANPIGMLCVKEAGEAGVRMGEDQLHEPMQGMAPNRPANERARSRVQVTGTAQVRRANQQVLQGRIFDVTTVGISIYLDIPLPVNESCELQLSVFRDGRVHAVNVRSHCSYNLLIGGKGFRNGFQFHSVSAEASATLSLICA